MLAGRQAEIHAARDRKLEEAASSAAAPACGRIAACTLAEHDYNDLARGNGSGLCRDATMLMDNLVELIEPMRNYAGADPLALCILT